MSDTPTNAEGDPVPPPSEARGILRKIHEESKSIPDADDDEPEEEDDDEPEEEDDAQDEEYLDDLAEELATLYVKAGGIGSGKGIGTGTVVTQLLAMQARDAVLDLVEKVEEVRDLLAQQDERAAELAESIAKDSKAT